MRRFYWLCGAALLGCAKAPSPPIELEATGVKVVRELSEPERRQLHFAPVQHAESVPRSFPATARVVLPPTASQWISAPVSARVTALSIEPGQRLETGQHLLTLASSEVAGVRAQLERGDALKLRAERLLEQERALRALDATSLADTERARQSLALAEAELHAARGSLSAWGATARGSAELVQRASRAGVVAEVLVGLGSFVATGAPLVRLIEPGAWRIHIQVPGFLLDRVAPAGTALTIGARGCSGTLRGHTYSVDPALGSATFVVHPGAACEGEWLEGRSFELSVPERPRADDSTLLVAPVAALSTYAGQPVLFVRSGDTAVRAQAIHSVEIWGDRVYFRTDGEVPTEVVDAGVVLVKGEFMRGQLE